MSTSREKRRQVPIDAIPPRMIQAVLAIEDRRFYEHPGIDPIRMVGALVTNLRGQKRYLVGGSTITQQLARNFFLTEQLAQEAATGQRSVRRKLLEQFMSLILERRASKDEILELYLNDVYLGQRGSFAIHGVAEASRLFFGKDVSNLSLAEAATIAGVIQSPAYWSPFHAPERSRTRRNIVLRSMAEAGYIASDAADRAAAEPLVVVQRALDAQAPYFIDLVGQTLTEQFPGLTASTKSLDVYTTLDIHLQRLAQDALREGVARVDEILAKRKRGRQAQAALIAVDPRTGDVLALVGGRSYNQSQFNRAVNARRQPGSTFKPFVYLAAFERGAAEGRTDLTPASLVLDEPTTFTFDETPEGRGRRATTRTSTTARSPSAARSRCRGTSGRSTSPSRPASTRSRRSGGASASASSPTPTRRSRSASSKSRRSRWRRPTRSSRTTARLRPLPRAASRGERRRRPGASRRTRRSAIARPDTTFLVTNMMRSVINEGTGASVRAAGFAKDAAGKTGTTNDLRDAWFIGFTPDLLTVVWVGLDDNQPLGLSGSQAAAPMWAQFMTRALQGEPDTRFAEPEGAITWADIDRDTGKLAQPGCPRVFHEAFIAGTEPTEACELHQF